MYCWRKLEDGIDEPNIAWEGVCARQCRKFAKLSFYDRKLCISDGYDYRNSNASNEDDD